MPVLPDIPKAEAAIVELANAFRSSAQLQAVKSDPALTRAARDFARFLAASTIFSHEADGRRPADRIKAAGYQACSTAENLAWMSDSRGFETRILATRMVEGWKGSPPHRKNLELPHVTETGVAIAKVRGQDKYMAVQLFGRPASLQYRFQIENLAGRPVDYAAFGKSLKIEPDTMVQHMVCEPGEVTFQLAPGGLFSKPATSRFATKDGYVFRLTRSSAGDIGVEVRTK
jgi:hypothetical protein